MLRACVLDFSGDWDSHLALIEFAYNNGYHSSIGMASYEALYGRACRTPICREETGERQMLGPDLIQETMEKVKIIRDRIRTAQDRQKSYADNRRRDLEFAVGDHVFLKVSPSKGIKRFGKTGKLSPRYVGPYQILARIGEVAYKLALPPELSGVHDVFHVSLLQKYVADPDHVIRQEALQVEEDLSYVEQPIKLLAFSEKETRNSTIPIVKVQWQYHDTATWELVSEIKRKYPHLFQ